MLRHTASAVVLPVRNYATLKDISIRLKSVKNIQKITASMKMVAAAKYAKAERELKPALPYGDGITAFYECAEITKEEKQPQHLIIAMTSDRGLCGAVHSSVSKTIMRDMTEEYKKTLDNTKIICVGDKSKQVLSRRFAKNIIASINEIGRAPPTFADAKYLAEAILNCGFDFKQGEVIFNRFKTVVSYTTMKLPFFSMDVVRNAEKMTLYDSVDENVLRSYLEFSLASLLYYVLKEAATAEHSSRMTSMDAATKNAGEMIDKLTIYYNRTRQAVITTELIEIISGAVALEG